MERKIAVSNAAKDSAAKDGSGASQRLAAPSVAVGFLPGLGLGLGRGARRCLLLSLAALAAAIYTGVNAVIYLNVFCPADEAPDGGPLCPAWLDAEYPPLPPDAVARALALRSLHGFEDLRRPFVDIVLLVPSVAEWTERRRHLRVQFARTAALLPAGSSAALLFVVGTRAYNGAGAPPVLPAGEAEAHADILQVDCTDKDGATGNDYPPSDSATSCKVLAGLVAAVARYNFHFVARVGDDAFFRFDTMLTRIGAAHLAEASNLALAFWMPGGTIGLPEERFERGGPAGFASQSYPPYMGGMGYVLSYNLSVALATAAARVGLRDAAAEDSMTGFWLFPFARKRLARVHTPCFHNHAEWVPAPPGRAAPVAKQWAAQECSASSLLVHYMTPALWSRIGQDGVLRDCGSMRRPAYCSLPPFPWLNPATA